ncbi:3-oxoacyl-(acyl-carrier-protein) synthase [Actinokineospora baliensis]|uniref:beta-ketoacyl-[acyl-carrier-protein] synthase family protein n=1 Tax=Actinokineospora baliensis TaxID=547056 RepID=UPI00195A3A94|nr:beta-ketoacyl synthase N-terminal-like domain-containing protein [Actinokineospora baliensis]MBM7772915.1 3-oxoacyl-(acyl-carrier-protein) synthase [Actinokineospora baliensis]
MAEGGVGVVVTGVAARAGTGWDLAALGERTAAGDPAFTPVTRFDASRYRTDLAAQLPGDPVLADELVSIVGAACEQAGLGAADRVVSPLLVAVHGDPAVARLPESERTGPGAIAASIAHRAGLGPTPRAYMTACVAASTAVADAATMITHGRAQRVVVAAGYLVEEDNFALFNAGRSLAGDGQVRPFSAGRQGMLLGDGLAAVVLESAEEADRRGATPLARIAGWGRAGDAFHITQPDPEGGGMTRAVTAALRKAGRAPADIGYINAHGTGTAQSDAAETAALHRALGADAARIPVSSSKSVHGHTLQAGGLLELAVTVHALRTARLPVNAGYVGPDDKCGLNLVLDRPLEREVDYALTVNSAFGGANTALVVARV